MKSKSQEQSGLPTIAFVGGGTGGHVYPGLAVIDHLKKQGSFRFVWIGQIKGVERSMVGRWSIPFVPIPAGKLRRYFSLKNISDLFRIAAGFFRARQWLAKNRPALVFSKGGFVSVPVVWAAKSLGIPVFSHESDPSPGLATRLNMAASELIFVAHEDARRRCGGGPRVIISGNPIRSELIEAMAQRPPIPTWLKKLQEDHGGRPILWIMGGSSGAGQLNDFVFDHSERLSRKYTVVHQTGPGKLRPAALVNGVQLEYIVEDFGALLAHSDVVISRAGAGSMWELGMARKPTLFVPLVVGSRGDQVLNGEMAESWGGARCFYGSQWESQLLEALETWADDPQLRHSIGQAWAGKVDGNGSARIADYIQKRIRTKKGQ